jgi:hypothetical protein
MAHSDKTKVEKPDTTGDSRPKSPQIAFRLQGPRKYDHPNIQYSGVGTGIHHDRLSVAPQSGTGPILRNPSSLHDLPTCSECSKRYQEGSGKYWFLDREQGPWDDAHFITELQGLRMK